MPEKGRMNNTVILASASPRRSELLAQVGIKFKTVPASVDETILEGETPEEYVLRLAMEKAKSVARDYENRWVIGADTAVVINGHIFGKPGSVREAREMLEKLSGSTHQVITGFCICNHGKAINIAGKVKTEVTFKELTRDEIDGYVASGEVMDKAGAYAIQGLGSFMVEEIHGSYSNVVGLPVCRVVSELERVGAVKLFKQ